MNRTPHTFRLSTDEWFYFKHLAIQLGFTNVAALLQTIGQGLFIVKPDPDKVDTYE